MVCGSFFLRSVGVGFFFFFMQAEDGIRVRNVTGGQTCALPILFERGFVTYSNDAKQAMLGVPPGTLEMYGAVSREIAQAMANGTLARAPVDLTVAVTGIAGPKGAVPGKPVGLVHFAAAS